MAGDCLIKIADLLALNQKMETLLFVVEELLNISFVIFQVICKSEKWINIDTASDVGCLIGLNLLYEVNHEKEKAS